MAPPKGIPSSGQRGQNFTLPKFVPQRGRRGACWEIWCGWCKRPHSYSTVHYTQEEAYVEHFHRKFDYCEPQWRARAEAKALHENDEKGTLAS
jgi:hypothetical protein